MESPAPVGSKTRPGPEMTMAATCPSAVSMTKSVSLMTPSRMPWSMSIISLPARSL